MSFGAKKDRSEQRKGFSLVEVVLALAICAFVLIGLLGLMTVGLTSSQTSQQDTVIALASQYVISNLRAKSSGVTALLPFPPTTQTYYFDHDGTVSAAVAPLKCIATVSGSPVPAAFSWGTSNPNIVGVNLTFTVNGIYATSLWTSLSVY